jgi:hypothetical protein
MRLGRVTSEQNALLESRAFSNPASRVQKQTDRRTGSPASNTISSMS